MSPMYLRVLDGGGVGKVEKLGGRRNGSRRNGSRHNGSRRNGNFSILNTENFLRKILRSVFLSVNSPLLAGRK